MFRYYSFFRNKYNRNPVEISNKNVTKYLILEMSALA